MIPRELHEKKLTFRQKGSPLRLAGNRLSRIRWRSKLKYLRYSGNTGFRPNCAVARSRSVDTHKLKMSPVRIRVLYRPTSKTEPPVINLYEGFSPSSNNPRWSRQLGDG
ncbi:hypothetical protein EVAR_43014_1 [Eumeta japonica]|uniref:Uncharacterized protein n=1 Tax=Eumeta variegata TaxID=151549 RepID=A0A4C1XKN2_EUMVA|nr:hypothetical protein EVAR_43014_1 [Eumeta japonica]